MKKIKAGKPAIDFIKACYSAGISPLLCGAHGIGKSEIIAQAALELEIECIVRDLSLMEPPDLVGLPKMSGQTTTYLAPDFLPRSGSGILLFEELNRCESYMRSPCLQLLTHRTLNDYELPRGWIAAAAVNPDDADYEVSSLDPALLSRFAKIVVVPDDRQWLAWAERTSVHPAVRDYVASDPSALEGPEANPRAWKLTSDALRALETTGSGESSALRPIVCGLVGSERGIAFLKTLKSTERPLTAEAVLSSYDKHRSKVCGWVRDGKLDLAERTLLALKKHLQPCADFQSVQDDKQRYVNLGRFLADLPGDQRDDAKQFFEERNYKFPTIRRKKRKQHASNR